MFSTPSGTPLHEFGDKKSRSLRVAITEIERLAGILLTYNLDARESEKDMYRCLRRDPYKVAVPKEAPPRSNPDHHLAGRNVQSNKDCQRKLRSSSFKPNDHKRLFILISSTVAGENPSHLPRSKLKDSVLTLFPHPHPPDKRFFTTQASFFLNQLSDLPQSMAKRPKLILRTFYAFRWTGLLVCVRRTRSPMENWMSRDFERRRRERQCPCDHRIWMDPIATTRRRRAKSLGTSIFGARML
ncbi:hypothetical protein C8R42DRAFT_649289 [Lentinula raphanica]|nr:hypothetical protein C8R42DRAFT_649289 [Lentinula raphanica]